MKKYLCVLTALMVIVGCATVVQKQWGVVSGSKADGVVTLAYEYGEMEKPVTDMAQGLDLAVKRCAAWGYKNATAFDSTMTNCIHSPGALTDCGKYRVTMEFQCLNE